MMLKRFCFAAWGRMGSQNSPALPSGHLLSWDSRVASVLTSLLVCFTMTGALVIAVRSWTHDPLLTMDDIYIESPVIPQQYHRNTSLVNLFLNEARVPNWSEPLLIHILAYQRTGSSFTAGLLGSDDRFFYIFEPLEMLYTAMYGLVEAWTKVPNDIFNDYYGFERELSDDEATASFWTMEKIYSCQLADLPTSLLISTFWGHFAKFMPLVPPYLECLRGYSVNLKYLTTCQKPIREICPDRFNTSEALELAICKHILWNNGEWYTSPNDVIWEVMEGGDVTKNAFKEYFQCLDEVAYETKICAETFLDIPCQARAVRIIKTVRTNANLPRMFFARYDNFRLMHVFRDPRGVALSRRKKTWARGQFEGSSISRIARTYCQNVLKDYIKTVLLKNQHPGKVMHIIADGVMQDVEEAASAMYHFINVSMLYSTRERLRVQDVCSDCLTTGATSYQRINMWKIELNRAEMREVVCSCQDFYRDVKFDWYHSKIENV